jgi:hypothetical protein
MQFTPELRQRLGGSPLRFVFGVALLALSCWIDCLGCKALFSEAVLVFLALHSLAVILSMLGLRWTWMARNRNERLAWSLFSFVVAVPLPLVGTVGLVLIRVLPGVLTDPSPLEELQAHTSPPPRPREAPRKTRQQQLRQGLEIGNQIDQAVGEISTVRSLVEASPGYQDRAKVEQLKRFLDNPRSDAYHLAQAEISRLQEFFVVSLAEAAEQVRKLPRDINCQLHLAEMNREYADSGLLELALENFYLRLSLDRYREIAKLDPTSPLWPLRRIELLMGRKFYSEAVSECQASLKQFPRQPDLYMRLLEAQFNGARNGSFEAIRLFFRDLKLFSTLLKGKPMQDTGLEKLAGFWFGPSREESQ